MIVSVLLLLAVLAIAGMLLSRTETIQRAAADVEPRVIRVQRQEIGRLLAVRPVDRPRAPAVLPATGETVVIGTVVEPLAVPTRAYDVINMAARRRR